MHIPLNLTGFFWSAVIVAAVAGIVMVIGLTLLLGTVPHRKVALPTVWISASLLIAALVAVIMILAHA
jgi:predicted tellurium resistance membrane protein TerC